MCLRFQLGFGAKCFVLLLLALPLAAQPIPDGAARVISVTGQVSMVRNGDLWSMHTSDILPAGQEIVTGPDGHAEMELQDGSRFEVFPDSRVVFHANRGNWRDVLDIFLGKVKVHIQRLGGRPNPARVHSPTALIAVRGTTFEVEVQSSDAPVVSVVEGLVEVSNRVRPGDSVLLHDGESVRVISTEPLSPPRVSKVNAVGKVMQVVLDRTVEFCRTVGCGTGAGKAPTGTPTPGGSTTPTGTATSGTSSSGTTTPPTGGRPGGVDNGDTGPGATVPPTTGGPGGSSGNPPGTPPSGGGNSTSPSSTTPSSTKPRKN